MDIVYKTDIVENVTSKGLKKFWQGLVLESEGQFYTQATFWQELAKGGTSKVNEADPVLIPVAKSQATIKDQAIFDITSAYRKQVDKISTSEFPLPMLAYPLAKKEKHLTFPSHVQPKYDGFRMLQRDGVCWTRKGKVWGVDKGIKAKCVEHLTFDTQGYVIDGELLLPHPFIREESASAAKDFHEETSPLLLYRVYDIMHDTLSYEDRYKLLQEILADAPPNVVLTPSHPVDTMAEVMQHFRQFLEEGWEGLMIRGLTAPYVNVRTAQLLKIKNFLEAEFLVTDVVAQDKRPTEGMIVIDMGDGKRCRVTCEGTRESRAALLSNRQQVIGQIWTVRFQEGLTKDGMLQFAAGVGQRDPVLDGEPDMFVEGKFRKHGKDSEEEEE